MSNKIAVVDNSPAKLMSIALENNADVDKLEKLMLMQERWDSNKAKDEGDFGDSELHQSFYKVVPLNDDSGYKTWHHPVKEKCKGAYFASVLYQY